jgi:hypothetical protein
VRRLALLLALIGALGLASCAGGDDQESVEDLLDQAFSGEIQSADLKLESEIELTGLLEDPIRIEAEGPFRTNEGKLPSADIELRIGSGGGQTISSGVLTTGDRAFLKFQDVYYEQPPAQVRATNRAIRRNARGGRTLGQLGLDPRSWLAEATDEGDAEVAGVDTNHVSGTLDVDTLMRDLNEFVGRSAAALGAGGENAAPQLTDEDIRELSEAVKDPSFDVYVGKEDHLIRRVSGRIDFEIPEANREGLGGLRGGTITFSVEFRDLNGDQQIEAPARSRPLSQLTESLGGAALDGIGEAPEEAAPEDGESPEADQFRRYAECLDKARPEDTEELQRCADILQE